MKLDKIFAGLNISSRGLSVQRMRMNTIAENIANAETTKTDKGGPYRRKQVVVSATQAQTFGTELRSAGMALARTDPNHVTGGDFPVGVDAVVPAVDAATKTDTSPDKMVYDPSHPDANAEGYVAMPNVNVVTEMVDMISASRAYEANVVAIGATKTMARDSLEI
jgi:flagellar basal-body rod protein FlgC